MDKLTPPQQLSFQFESNQQDSSIKSAEKKQTAEKFVIKHVPSNSVVVNFNDALLQREKARENNLYKQILDSVRHIG